MEITGKCILHTFFEYCSFALKQIPPRCDRETLKECTKCLHMYIVHLNLLTGFLECQLSWAIKQLAVVTHLAQSGSTVHVCIVNMTVQTHTHIYIYMCMHSFDINSPYLET